MIGKRLRDLRLNRGLTQQELGEAIGGDKQQISRIERGAMPTLEVVKKLAEYLEVSTDYLLDLVDEPHARLKPTDLSPDERKFVDAIRGKSFQKVVELLAAFMADSGVNGGAA